MARVAGVDLPKNKRIDIALRYVYGIGPTYARKILESLSGQIAPATRVKDLTEQQVSLLNTIIQKEYKVEGELRREVAQSIHRYLEIGAYRGLRHRRNLPARGQRTRTNARTRRGKRKTVGSGKPGKSAASAGK
ncbi:MAG: 30S ribosomal protein S13 [Elusimicrobiales bacterium]|nr:30S ribosomal protein S13 [Elusimicrobiales bacterium]